MGIFVSSFRFNGPIPLSENIPELSQGLYAIFIHDKSRIVDPYKLIYIGDSEEISELTSWRSFHRYDCWLTLGGENLYIGVCPLPQQTSAEKKKILSMLIQEHSPTCNVTRA
jgi:hypothetical protein